jgi:hypothetical protein
VRGICYRGFASALPKGRQEASDALEAVLRLPRAIPLRLEFRQRWLFEWTVIQIGALTFYRRPVDNRSGVRNATIALTAPFAARFGTTTAVHRSGGHPACRRAGRLARRNRCSNYHQVENFGRRSGRQDAALYGRQGCLPLPGGGVERPPCYVAKRIACAGFNRPLGSAHAYAVHSQANSCVPIGDAAGVDWMCDAKRARR